MNKWYGKIGFAVMSEITPGEHRETLKEVHYYGDILKNSRALQNSTVSTNSNVRISNQISILADPYARDHIYDMRCIEFQGARWKISDVNVQYPRLVISMGDLYNG